MKQNHVITAWNINRNLYFLKQCFFFAFFFAFFLFFPLHCAALQSTHGTLLWLCVLSLWYHSLTDKEVRGGVGVMIVERNVPEEVLQRAVNCGNPLSHCHQLLAGPLITRCPVYRCIRWSLALAVDLLHEGWMGVFILKNHNNPVLTSPLP